MIRLPETYCTAMRGLLGEEYQAYLDSFHSPSFHGLRVNTAKISPEEFERLSPFSLRRIPWVENGFYYEGDSFPARHPYYYAGLYYLQEPSAMTPASRLPIRPGDRVLDLCAAPGGKATELGARLKGQGFLLANDISPSRAQGLLKNLELAGIPNLLVTAENPRRLAQVYPDFFDKILIDAPCSGEGMFRRDSKMVTHWESAPPDSYVEVQQELLEYGFRMLRPGGQLLYSTCTFSPKENEENVLELLKAHSDLHPLPVDTYRGFSPGFCGLKEAVRIFPHKVQGEGHFLVLLEKEASGAALSTDASSGEILSYGSRRGSKGTFKGQEEREPRAGLVSVSRLPEEMQCFLRQVRLDFTEGGFRLERERLYYYGPELTVRPGLRYLRTGLLMGSFAHQRFEPSQALAMAFRGEEFDAVVNLDAKDPLTVKYLKGESLPADLPVCGSDPEGSLWRLVCADGYPLGWAKAASSTLKNKYCAGWRWQ